MKAPLSWLKELVDFEATPEALAERLTLAGLEVEGIMAVGSDFDGVVVGEIVGIEPYPQAERLSLCRVNNGREILRVVCGATNFKIGDKAPFAGVGAALPGGRPITPARIRGEESQGMLCAEDELGLSDDHSGLMLLPRDTPVGTPFATIAGPSDKILVIEVTPNRPDCLSLIGIAREITALYGGRLKLPPVEFVEIDPAATGLTAVMVEDGEACPRYIARILKGVSIVPSPLWMRLRLTRCDIRPINNLVDITNYVMLECGQPLHVFDQELLAEGRIVVRHAHAGERLSTLDGIERALNPELLVIADAQRPVAVAGVMGGAGSGIRAETRTVLLESACFKPALIRRGSKLMGLATESSYRFERGVDVDTVDWASRRAAQLMVQLAGATAARGAVDVFPVPPPPRQIVCRFDRVRNLLGLEVSDSRIRQVFESLQLGVRPRDRQACEVSVPTFRVDLESEADLIEEVARMIGLDQIPVPAPQLRIVPGADDAPMRAGLRCRAALVGLGLTEIMNYSFTSRQLLDLFDPAGNGRQVVLPHPLSAEHSVLRHSLLPQMGETLGRNRSRQNTEAAFFEMGRVFYKGISGEPDEEERLAVGLMGSVGRPAHEKRRWPTEEETFLWLKGILENLGAALSIRTGAGGNGTPGLTGLELNAAQGAETFPTRCFEANRSVAVVLDGAVCGVLGLLKKEIRQTWRILEPVGLLEMSLKPLLRRVGEIPMAGVLPVYPAVTRDVAMLVKANVRHADIIRVIWKMAPKELTAVKLFDIYHDKKMGEGCKSMAYSLVYRAADRTLTDDEVNTMHNAVKTGLKAELKIEVREG